MSQVAGRLAVQEGAKYLEKTFGGRGVLLGGVPGVHKGKVVILGGGVAGTNACKIALGMGAEVTILDISTRRLAELDDLFGDRVQTLYASPHNIELEIREADLVIGAVLIPGAAAPKLILRRHLATMKPGAVIVDIAVDQGGCVETTRPTTHANPVFIEEGIVHYCVANMPGAVSRTSTLALTNATIRYGLLIADKGVEKALASSAPLRAGLNCHTGRLTHPGVAEAHGLPLAVWP
jgi:alanine dehydrogenase